ncbi:MAG TPA: hypothetical protein EYG73_00015 [Arcobacter sp.]|nr:hypothetical protein [Arcobacter sp.]
MSFGLMLLIKWNNVVELDNKQLKNSKGYYHFVHLDFLENMPENSWFWTSEEKDLSHVWRIGFERGGDGWYEKLDLSYVLCVK